MRKEFIAGMIAAPILFFLYLGVKIMFKPGVELSEEEKKDYLIEINFTRERAKDSVPTLPLLQESEGKFKEIKLQDLRGKPTIIHFWATWCKPCAFEMPEFYKFAEAHKREFNILTISGDQAEKVEDAHDTISHYIQKNGYKHLKVAYDFKANLARAMKLAGYPTTILLDKEGKEIGRFNGVLFWNDPLVIMTLKSLLA